MQQPRFNQQRFRKRRRDPCQRLVRERDLAPGNREHFPCESESGQEFENPCFIGTARAQKLDLVGAEMESRYELDGEFQPCRKQKRSPKRSMARVEIEGGRTTHAMAPRDVRGIDVIKVDVQTAALDCEIPHAARPDRFSRPVWPRSSCRSISI